MHIVILNLIYMILLTSFKPTETWNCSIVTNKTTTVLFVTFSLAVIMSRTHMLSDKLIRTAFIFV